MHVSTFAWPCIEMGACEKLRAQQSVCKQIRVSIRTGMFNPDEAKYAREIICELPYPTDDTRMIAKAAVASLDRVFRSGFAYSKAEILLLGLCQRRVHRRPIRPYPARRG